MTSADPMDPFDVPRLLAGMTTAAAVTAFLTRLTAPLGFPVHVIGALPHPHQPYPERFIHANWPPAWHDAYFNRGFGEHDPVQRAAIMLGSSFSLDDLRKGAIGPLTVRETEVLDFAAALGFPHGFATPVYRDNGYTGLACVVGPGPDPAPRTRALLQFLLMHAHDRLRALGVDAVVAPCDTTDAASVAGAAAAVENIDRVVLKAEDELLSFLAFKGERSICSFSSYFWHSFLFPLFCTSSCSRS